MGKVIAICNQKGGVGKTTTALSTAVALSKDEYKVLVIDCDDGNAGLTKQLGYDSDRIEYTLTDLLLFEFYNRMDMLPNLIDSCILHHSEGIDVITADNKLAEITNNLASAQDENKRKTLSRILNKIRDRYDYILLDTAPTLNILFVNALAATDEVVVVTQSQGAAEAAIGELIQTVINVKERINPSIIIKGLLINMVDNRIKYEKDKSQLIDRSYSDLGMKVFKNKIPRAIAAAKSFDENKSIFSFDARSPVAIAYKNFAEELISD